MHRADSGYGPSPDLERISYMAGSKDHLHASSVVSPVADMKAQDSSSRKGSEPRPSREISHQRRHSERPRSTKSTTSSRPRTHHKPSLSTNTSAYGREEDPLLLYQRSCSLFNQRTITPYPSPPSPFHPSLHRVSTSTPPRPSEENSPPPVPTIPSHYARSSIEPLNEKDEYTLRETVNYWTSDETRRREYAEIDRDTKGMRGMWRKMAPKCIQQCPRQGFYGEKDEKWDTGSVRRYRLDMPEDDNACRKSAHKRKGGGWSCFGA